MIYLIVFAVLGSFALSLIATILVRHWARRIGFVDRPGGHKQHHAPVALGGGIAIATCICLPILAGTFFARLFHSAPPVWLPSLIHTHLNGMASKFPIALGIVIGAAVLHVMGLIDDRKPLGPGIKFLVEYAVAFGIAGPFGIRAVEFLPAPLSIGLTAIWLVLIINAFNFLDNMDGLSAGVAAIAATTLGLASLMAGQVFVPTMAFVTVGVLLGYLVFNFPPATIFMGDAGSLVVGYTLGILTILTTYYESGISPTPLGVLVPPLVLAIPLYDVISVVIHRARLHVSPIRGDRRHFSHRLVRRGLSTRWAVLTIYLATAATGLPAILLPILPWWAALLLFIQCVCVTLIISILESAGGKSTVE
ncbi:MAG: undecaprenyl/decaprenyl-phosphate alpha-N-acetylglucosaminyl 1-phosphate transferase [Planctomycetes bacterium]|nr:undecaprenyl/decaprenyl-phosphate alpha-N-acetylglucosaminyl 1-phosphate transferase [Planctomycetota bacterium]MBI3836089.1 undecaprenyl/decaprenyl-phosphate alpha-N-acetylglucosaminyl 1-phosphate transferase [Planctomycetota bacterium]